MESTLLVKFWPHLFLNGLVFKNPLFRNIKNALTPLTPERPGTERAVAKIRSLKNVTYM